MRKIEFVTSEFYHIYNRGVEGRDIFLDEQDYKRFVTSMREFNQIEPIGSLYENSQAIKHNLRGVPDAKGTDNQLIHIIAYCLNPNHLHFILEQIADDGISKFMGKLCGGYAWYFNNRYRRKGVLFQGRFKAKHIDTNEYLLHVSAYVNLNNRVHQLGVPDAKSFSSWDEYLKEDDKNITRICERDIVLSQFRDKNDYELFAESSLGSMLDHKEQQRDDLKALLLE
jgi:putative transposase